MCRQAIPRAEPSLPIQISREQAASIAEKECRGFRLQQVDPPHLKEARLMGRAQADAILLCDQVEGCLAVAQTPDLSGSLVWLVELAGRWQYSGGPEPTRTPVGQTFSPTSAPVFLTRCRVEIDAMTGEWVGPMRN